MISVLKNFCFPSLTEGWISSTLRPLPCVFLCCFHSAFKMYLYIVRAQQGQHVQDAISLSMITFCIACTCSSLGVAPDCLCWCWAPSNTGPQLQGSCLWHLCQHRLKSCWASHRGPVAASLIARSGWEKSTVIRSQILLQQRHIAEPKRAEQWTADSVRWGNPSSCWAVTSSLCLLLPVLTFPALLRWNKQEGAYCQNTLKQMNKKDKPFINKRFTKSNTKSEVWAFTITEIKKKKYSKLLVRFQELQISLLWAWPYVKYTHTDQRFWLKTSSACSFDILGLSSSCFLT